MVVVTYHRRQLRQKKLEGVPFRPQILESIREKSGNDACGVIKVKILRPASSL